MTARLKDGLPSLRRKRVFVLVRRCIADGHKEGFRVVHFSVMRNHFHFVVEAENRSAVSEGMKGLKVRIAKALNRQWGRKGSPFAGRYHDRPIASPAEARNALLYVLNNSRRHAAQGGVRLAPRWVDPYSSARQFDGWRQPVRREPGVTVPPQTWLLRVGWRRRGLLDAHGIPGG